MAGLSGCDSFPLGKCPLKWHSSPFPSGSVLSVPSAESLEPSRPHPHGLTTESQASTRRSREPFVLTTPCRNLKGGKRVGLTYSRVWPRPRGAWHRASRSAGPSTPAQQSRFRVSVRWRPPEAGERGIQVWGEAPDLCQAQIVSRYQRLIVLGQVNLGC